MKQLLFVICILFFASCIKDDFVDDFVQPEVRITASLDSLAIDSSFQGTATYFDNVGKEEFVDLVWSSSNEAVATVGSSSGLIKGVAAGSCIIRVRYLSGNTEIIDSFTLVISPVVVMTVVTGEKSGTVATTSSYPLSGSYTLRSEGDDLTLTLSDDYTADNSLPGLYIYLSNNNQSTSEALEIGPVEVFNGAHSYTITNTGINDYGYILYFCKPFNVKVGEGLINMN